MNMNRENIERAVWLFMKVYVVPMTIVTAVFNKDMLNYNLYELAANGFSELLGYFDFIPVLDYILAAVTFILWSVIYIPFALAAQFPDAAVFMAGPLALILDMDAAPFFLYLFILIVRKPDLHWFDPKGAPKYEDETEYLKSLGGIPFSYAIAFNFSLVMLGYAFYPPMDGPFAPGFLVPVFLIFFMILMVRGNSFVRSILRSFLWTLGAFMITAIGLIAVEMIKYEFT